MKELNLLPQPRSLRHQAGHYLLPTRGVLHLPADLPRDTVLLPVAGRLQSGAESVGVELELVTGPARHPHLAISAERSERAPDNPEGYVLHITKRGVAIQYREAGGLRAAAATLRQLMRQCGRKLPCLTIRDHPDFGRRGVMLDVSRGRVPRVETLLELIDHLADFKVNEFQVYIEHTFAYRDYEPVWRDWGALTGEEILRLDARCRELGMDFVPNQNSFGHLRSWLEHPPLRKLAEIQKPYLAPDSTFLRYPSTLAPNHPQTIPFLRGLYDELLPHFTSTRFNVGCDETWDLGRGRSRSHCERQGKGRVYLEFLRKIHREVKARGRQMMFWGDIILHHPELVKELPKDVIALNWGYDHDHPFDREAGVFAQSKVPFYVCPGTSTWMTLIGKHDNGLANLRLAADMGLKHGAAGYLNTDWGDGGHPQPLAVSYLPYLAGAALSWFGKGFEEKQLVPALNRDVFGDPTGRMGQAAWAMGFAHLKFKYNEPNITPFGAVIAAPEPKTLELFCRSGLKQYARIQRKNIVAAMETVEAERARLYRSAPSTHSGEMLAAELDMAARMAVQSCHHMLWQQALAEGRKSEARRLAQSGIRALQDIDRDYNAYWPARNKATPAKSSAFLKWRIADYRKGVLHFPPEAARLQPAG